MLNIHELNSNSYKYSSLLRLFIKYELYMAGINITVAI